MKPEGISIVIPFRNSEQTLTKTLDCLLCQEVKLPIEVIFVDDRSTDGSQRLIDAHDLTRRWQIRKVQNEDGGLANAYNLGWRASQYEYIVVMHSDCYVERDDALQTIIDYLCMDGVVAAEPWTIVPLQTWDEMSFWDKVANARFVGVEAPGLGGKFDGLRRSALEEIDGYDAKRFFSAGEDVDIAVRLRKIGKVVDTGVRVIHRHLYPDRSSVKFLLLKQVQYGQGFGAIIRKYGRYSGSLFTGSVHVAKILLLAALFVPPLSLYALALLGVLAAAYSWRAFQVWDWRILAIIPVNIFQWIVFFASTVIGFVTGRQAIYYK